MKKIYSTLLLSLIVASGAVAQTAIPKADTRWFEEARLGMFVHFGPYSVLGAGEWVMNTRPIVGKDYMRLQELFNPQAFDAAEWVRIAKEAGMKYITFTSRHHDGFSNWDTKQSDWNIMNTPYGRDLIRQLADECHREGIKLIFYYSTIDWMREDYQWETGRTGQKSGRTGPSNFASYFEFMKAQLTELLTNYGPIAGIWFDGHWDQTADENRTDQRANIDWRYPELYAHIRSLSPECLIANNHHLPPFAGEDYQIFERDVPGENKAGYSGQKVSRLPLETCQTINRSWGFNITDDNFKSAKELIHLIVRTAGTGANLLLNVGPMPNGVIQPECVERLQEIGRWMQRHGHTVYGTQMGMVKPQEWGATTRKGNTYYIHVLDPEVPSVTLDIPGIQSARWVNVTAPLSWKKGVHSDQVTFEFLGGMNPIDSIIEVTVAGDGK
ncbi:alpha-L-fucosidase [Alistipes sp. OttesenSCG-928-B03]|nr:alpha-L-fucosidase [Alistipes sp. OttesenSCG-928-B03]